ncbi:unnamed protein product [Gemmataceae bacterium]|nr:unnamed protein product [Gemmataceae bacterium]VTU02562.1 unnamed protein product [Gemmataceae bacterium]
MTPYPDPRDLTPDDRLRELSRLLAAGLLRLALTATCAYNSGSAEPSTFDTNDLAVRGEKSVTVHAG